MVAVDIKGRFSFRKPGMLALLIMGITTCLQWPSQGHLLTWDEVDYVNAARRGAWSNMVERGSIGLVDYVEFARSKYWRREPRYPRWYDESRDPLLLRHYHPPLVVLMLSGLSASCNEHVLRSVQNVGTLFLIGVTLFSFSRLTAAPSWPGIVVVSLLALRMSLMLFSSLSFHGWAAVWITSSAALLSHWLNAQSRSVGIALCASLALAILTLETGLIVMAAVPLCLALWKAPTGGGELRAFPWRSLVTGGALISVIVLVIWPGAVVKASFLKIPALYLYRIWLGDEYASVSPNTSRLIRSLLPEIALGAMACLWLPVAGRSNARRWGPLLIVGGLYTVALARFALAPTYLIAAFGPIACAAGMAVDLNKSTVGRGIVMGAAVLTIGAAWPIGSATESDQAGRDDLLYLQNVLRGREALMDGEHIYRYYLGPGYSIRPITVSYEENTLTIRERGAYRRLGPEEIKGKVIVIQKSRRTFPSGTAARILLGGCPAEERRTILIYDCAEDS